MAKLKIVDRNGAILEEGYVNVVTELVYTPNANIEQKNLRDFIDADPENRPEMLQKYADPRSTGLYKVTQEKANGQPQEIDNDNCRIYAQKDVKKQNKNRSRVTMPIPDAAISDFSYLDDYVRKIVQLWNTDQEKCRRFMFGMMMLTRCR